jgi:uncharacterized damage-inducible protein DinB
MIQYSAHELAASFRTVRTNTLQIAQEIPQEQYGFRATPDTRSVAETLAHMAAQSLWHHQLHVVDGKTFITLDDFKGYMQAVRAHEAILTTKEALVSALERDGEHTGAWLDGLTDAMLNERVGFPPPITPSEKTRFEMLLGLKEHEMHHRAQLMLIERLLGIVPHLTRARQARQA